MFRSIANAAEPGIDKAMKLYGRSIANAAKRRVGIDKAMKLFGRSTANAAKRISATNRYSSFFVQPSGLFNDWVV